MKRRLQIFKKTFIPDNPNAPVYKEGKLSRRGRTGSGVLPMHQKGSDRVGYGRREPKPSCKMGEDIHCKGTEQEEMLDILDILLTQHTTAWTMKPTGLKLLPCKNFAFF